MSAFTVETLLAANRILQQENERLRKRVLQLEDEEGPLLPEGTSFKQYASGLQAQIADLTAKLEAAQYMNLELKEYLKNAASKLDALKIRKDMAFKVLDNIEQVCRDAGIVPKNPETIGYVRSMRDRIRQLELLLREVEGTFHDLRLMTNKEQVWIVMSRTLIWGLHDRIRAALPKTEDV